MKKYFIIIIATISLHSCNKKNNDNIKEQASAIPVVVSKSDQQKYIPEISFSGTAFANKEANLGTALPGRVEKIHYKEGERVQRGDLLVELSAELYTQALIERNAIKKDLERVSRLREKESISEQDYDHIKAKYDAAVAKTKMMKKNAEIKAPFHGVVVEHIVQEGENFFFAPSLKPGYSMTSGIIKLMQLDLLNVEIDINEKDISRIHKGQNAEVVFDSYPNKTYTGEVIQIDPILSTISRTVRAQVRIKNQNLLIKPGMYAKVHLKLPEKEAIFVPNESIYRQPGTGKDFVFVVKDNKVEKTSIERRYTLKDLVAVEGIKANQTIVVAGKSKLRDGMQVDIKEK